MREPIPFLDLDLQHKPLRAELLARMAEVVDSHSFAGGPAVESFERQWADYCQVALAVGVSNGTDSMEIALRALDLPTGSGVVIPANTFVATAAAVKRAGLRSVLCDVAPDTLLADADRMAAAIDTSVTALAPVHLYGQMVDVAAITTLARTRSLVVVEDAAQAHGASRGGTRPGQLSAAASFSFYPGKNLGALGEAGAVVTNDAALDRCMREIRNHGGTGRGRHDRYGFNARMDGIQGAALSVKLAHLDRWNDDRRRAAARYLELLKDVPAVDPPVVAPGSDPVWHLFVVRVDDRDAVAATLGEQGITTSIHYPAPVHLTGAFNDLGYCPGDFPVAEAAAPRLLSLPMFPGITDDQIERVVTALAGAVER
jgi:dTDP-4-amino-4,6-dideoxygalactose transaminase